MKLIDLSPAVIMEKMSVERFQTYLDTGIYDRSRWSITWDMLAWLKWYNEKK